MSTTPNKTKYNAYTVAVLISFTLWISCYLQATSFKSFTNHTLQIHLIETLPLFLDPSLKQLCNALVNMIAVVLGSPKKLVISGICCFPQKQWLLLTSLDSWWANKPLHFGWGRCIINIIDCLLYVSHLPWICSTFHFSDLLHKLYNVVWIYTTSGNVYCIFLTHK